MPAFQVGPYLGAAIESVCAQTYADWELVITDDGSTDTTAAIAARWAARDPRVRLLRQSNKGISAARNHSLRAAKGVLLAILDSDDVWEPTYLGEQVAILNARPEVDIVTANALFLGSRLNGQPARPFPDARPEPDLANILADETSVFIMSVFRRRVYETIGDFDETFRTNEDYDYWIRAAAAGFRFARNDRPLGRYRRRDDSLSASEVRMLKGILRVFLKTRPLVAERPFENALLEAQICRFGQELVAAEARAALETGDARAISDRLTALHTIRGGTALGIACMLARLSPGLLSRAYQVRRAVQEART